MPNIKMAENNKYGGPVDSSAEMKATGGGEDMRELFRAMELAHYAARFRDKVFVVALAGDTPFGDLLMDLMVLLGYRIQLVLVLADPDYTLQDTITRSNNRGTRFHLSLLTDVLMSGASPAEALDYERLSTVLAQGDTPIIACQHSEPAHSEDQATFDLAAEVAHRMSADKLFLIGREMGAVVAAIPASHVMLSEITESRIDLPDVASAVMPFVRTHLERGIPDIVLLDAAPAALFREVFTHDGAGVLFNRSRASKIRPAHVRDLTDIALLLKPEVDAGRILPTSEDAIEQEIGYYYVYEIDGLPVGFARLKVYGDHAEVAQFATLQRYRGKGRAKELANYLADVVRGWGFSAVFALSVDPRMWDFFLDLGYETIDRDKLPAAWKEQYDLSRPSRAFLKRL